MSDMNLEAGACSDAANTDRSDIAAAILSLLAASPDPLPVSKLKAGLRKPHDLPAEELVALVAGHLRLGTVFRYAPLRGEGFRYWDRDRGHYLDTLIERELRAAALPIHTLRSRVARRLGDASETELRERIEGLLRVGRLHELPRAPGSRSARLSARPPDPKAYLSVMVQRLVQAVEEESLKLEACGLTRSAVYAAARALLEESVLYGRPAPDGVSPHVDSAVAEQDLEHQILEQLRRLSADLRHGGLVSTRELRGTRPRFAYEHAAFDRALLRLAKDGRVWLFRHDFPASLTESERKAMVTDGRGNYYNGISFKE
ncbi:MAG: hypothetical protein ACREXS_00465, partial [Gammaproteobacteria bacterium]